ncbi:hypothetical protein [Sunxiuqinia indica]|jgi:hypothetical protein|uniref:hypothetical protein n=1 Tax=Sunxiuqinia indica TaxID=2692584 RepID=UPI001358A4F3|nr:hypothetical protein [Sunxiuqinia indica]
MSKDQKKILTGFRLSEGNVNFIEDTSKRLGLNKTSALDMLLTVVRKDKRLLTDLIKKALEE